MILMNGIGFLVDKLATRTIKRRMPCDKPENMTVGVNKRTGLPYLKKK